MTKELQFGEYLKEIRKEKGLTLRQIEKVSGVSNAYLSQVENGKRSVPTPDILMKIHEALGVSYEELMEKAGYISTEVRSELIPETVQTMESFNDFVELMKNATEMFIGAVTDEDGFIKNKFKKHFVNEIQKDFPELSKKELDELLNDPDVFNQIFNHLTMEERISFLNVIIKDFVGRGIDPNKVFKSNSQKISENLVPILRVPVLGYIAAGQPILADDHIEEWIEVPNMWNLKEGEVLVLKVKGDSMIGSRIFEGDRVVVKIQPEVENGEIAVVNINGSEATLKRVKKTENGQVILYPDNPKYEPIFITNERSRVIGKVIQVMFEP